MRQCRSPTSQGRSADADRISAANALPVWGAISEAERGSERKRFGPFHVSSHTVAGRLPCLTVVPALVIFNVTPPPE
jgi:hypothetical protein